jgi:hypothetical protein
VEHLVHVIEADKVDHGHAVARGVGRWEDHGEDRERERREEAKDLHACAHGLLLGSNGAHSVPTSRFESLAMILDNDGLKGRVRGELLADLHELVVRATLAPCWVCPRNSV